LIEVGVKYYIFNIGKTIVINKGSSNGLDLKRFTSNINSHDEINSLKQKIGISKDRIMFGFVGRINDRKGIYELIEAFKLLQESQKISLLILGDFEFNQLKSNLIKDEIESNTEIFWVGYQTDVPLYMSIMDVFIMPSWSEGFGNVYVQAAAVGLPVIGTKVTGVKDAVSHNYNGILVEPKNIIDLTEAMKRLIIDEGLRIRLGKNGLEWAKNFKPEVIWDGYVEIYNNLLADNV
jgi:glycosyltransferase involved in cell wall biosynthesis